MYKKHTSVSRFSLISKVLDEDFMMRSPFQHCCFLKFAQVNKRVLNTGDLVGRDFSFFILSIFSIFSILDDKE